LFRSPIQKPLSPFFSGHFFGYGDSVCNRVEHCAFNNFVIFVVIVEVADAVAVAVSVAVFVYKNKGGVQLLIDNQDGSLLLVSRAT
jgi:hypothetical protein